MTGHARTGRDAYVYTMDWHVTVRAGLTPVQQELARRTLTLAGPDDRASSVIDSKGRPVAIDSFAQRTEMWLIALDSKSDLMSNPSDAVRRQMACTAIGHGFFSIWMSVFEDDVAVRRLLIEAFTGTASDCFDRGTTTPVSPRPANGLADGSKI